MLKSELNAKRTAEEWRMITFKGEGVFGIYDADNAYALWLIGCYLPDDYSEDDLLTVQKFYSEGSKIWEYGFSLPSRKKTILEKGLPFHYLYTYPFPSAEIDDFLRYFHATIFCLTSVLHINDMMFEGDVSGLGKLNILFDLCFDFQTLFTVFPTKSVVALSAELSVMIDEAKNEGKQKARDEIFALQKARTELGIPPLVPIADELSASDFVSAYGVRADDEGSDDKDGIAFSRRMLPEGIDYEDVKQYIDRHRDEIISSLVNRKEHEAHSKG